MSTPHFQEAARSRLVHGEGLPSLSSTELRGCNASSDAQMLEALCTQCNRVCSSGPAGKQCAWTVVLWIADSALLLAVSQRGCRALIRVLKCVDAARKEALVGPLLPLLAELSIDPFANYVVQCIIEHSDRTTSAQYVVQFLAGHLLLMSCDKFASNVVEKIIRVCGGVPAVRRLLLDELVFNPAALRDLVSNSYGNFVVQSVVATACSLDELRDVSAVLSPLLPASLYSTNIGAKVSGRRRELQLLQHSWVAPCTAHSLPASCAPLPESVGEEEKDALAGKPACGSRAGRYQHRPYDVDVLAKPATSFSSPRMYG